MLSAITPGIKEFIVLGAEEDEGAFVLALAKEEFKVWPIAFPQKVKEIERPSKKVEYKEAGYRNAIKLDILHDRLYT